MANIGNQWPADYAERVYAGVLGKIIGVYLGRPFEGWTFDRLVERFGEVTYYVHDQLGVPLVVADDDISGTFTFPRALSDHSELTPAQIGETWLNYIVENRTVLWWGGMGTSTEHTAYLRLKSGVKAPLSGSIEVNGRTVAEQIGAQIFIDGWGLICPGEPERAADYARRAGSVSHDGEAVFAAQVVAAMVALAFVEYSVDGLLDGALACVPRDCLIARLIGDVREWHAAGLSWRDGFRRIEAKYGYDKYGGGCHVVPNHAMIIHALLHGGGDFSRSLAIVNTCGWDTDCNSGNVGCILGVRDGLKGIDSGHDWRGPVADRMYLPTADGGRCITDAVAEALRIATLGCASRGRRFEAPKAGGRFHFCFPGAVQGFVVLSGEIANVEHEGARMLGLWAEEGEPCRAMTPTFLPPEVRQAGGYGIAACPTLYPGQKVTARVVVPWSNGHSSRVRVMLGRYNERDALSYESAEPVDVSPGRAVSLEWEIPDFGGYPIAEIGIETSGHVLLDWLTWDWDQSRPARRLEFVASGEREALQLQAQKLGFAFADLDRVSIERTAINVVPQDLVTALRAIPVKRDGNTLYVATSSPTDVHLREAIQEASGYRIVPIMAAQGAIDEAITKYYGVGPVVKLRRPPGGTAWRDAWVNAVDHFENWGEPFRLIQDRGTGLLIQGCREWHDYEASAKLDIHLVERAGIAVHVQGLRRWVGLFLCRDGLARLIKCREGERVLAKVRFEWEFGETHELTLRAEGNRYAAFVDGRDLFEVVDKDQPLDEGAIAFILTEGRIGAQEFSVRPLGDTRSQTG